MRKPSAIQACRLLFSERTPTAQTGMVGSRAPAVRQPGVPGMPDYHPTMARTMRTPAVEVLLFATMILTVGCQMKESRSKIDIDELGPQVGERVPDFSLPDQTGRPVSLASILGPNGAILMFYRSADW
jgi:hypothetical protein